MTTRFRPTCHLPASVKSCSKTLKRKPTGCGKPREKRSAPGRTENRMRWASFDVRDLQGKTAVLEMVDRESGGWGNIGVDQIVFSKEPIPGETGARIAGAARKFQLAPALLADWVMALQDVALRDK